MSLKFYPGYQNPETQFFSLRQHILSRRQKPRKHTIMHLRALKNFIYPEFRGEFCESRMRRVYHIEKLSFVLEDENFLFFEIVEDLLYKIKAGTCIGTLTEARSHLIMQTQSRIVVYEGTLARSGNIWFGDVIFS